MTMMTNQNRMMTIRELAQALGAQLFLPPGLAPTMADAPVCRIASIAAAGPDAVTFVSADSYASLMATTEAAAIIVATAQPTVLKPQILHRDPYWAFAKTAQLFWQRESHEPGIRPGAMVADGAQVHPTATVMAGVYVGAGATVGARTVLFPGVYLGRDAVIGDDTEIRANVVVEHGCQVGSRCLIHAGTVIGADGFGFAPGPQGLEKIPQTGRVCIGDDVEIGALCTIDRGALDDTVVGPGTKMDSHVHVGHGVTIGAHSILCAFAGVAGSARIGNGVVLGGHVGVTNKVELADGVQVGAMSGVTKSLKKKDTYIGFPAIPQDEWRRQVVGLRRMERLEARIKELEQRLNPRET